MALFVKHGTNNSMYANYGRNFTYTQKLCQICCHGTTVSTWKIWWFHYIQVINILYVLTSAVGTLTSDFRNSNSHFYWQKEGNDTSLYHLKYFVKCWEDLPKFETKQFLHCEFESLRMDSVI